MPYHNPNLSDATNEHINERVRPRQERRFIEALQEACPRCDASKVSTTEDWLFYRIDTARRRGPIKAARRPKVHQQPKKVAMQELRRYPLPSQS